jgi:transposase, IS5 family
VSSKLKTPIETVMSMKALKPVEFERLIVDSMVQEKAIAHPTDSRLLDVAREQIVRFAQRAGIKLKLTARCCVARPGVTPTPSRSSA